MFTHHTRKAAQDSPQNIDRRACLSILTAGLASLCAPKSPALGQDIDEPEPVHPVNPAMVAQLVGTYDLRVEWPIEGRILVRDPRPSTTAGHLPENGEVRWVEHWRMRQVIPYANIRTVDGLLVLETNFKWEPTAELSFGDGTMFQVRLDGQRQTFAEGRGYAKLLRMLERDETSQNLENGIRQNQEWWYRLGSRDPWKPLKNQLTTLAVESPGMLVLTINRIQETGLQLEQFIGSIRFRRRE